MADRRRTTIYDIAKDVGASPTAVSLVLGGTWASVTLTWSNLPNFGLWTKPGAPFVCLEPWHGMSALVGAGDAMLARPSTIVLEPGDTSRFELSAAFNAAH